MSKNLGFGGCTLGLVTLESWKNSRLCRAEVSRTQDQKVALAVFNPNNALQLDLLKDLKEWLEKSSKDIPEMFFFKFMVIYHW